MLLSLIIAILLADPLLAGSQMNPVAYKAVYPIQVFDVSKQRERLTEVVVDLTVKMESSANVPADTHAYALVISDLKRRIKDERLILDGTGGRDGAHAG